MQKILLAIGLTLSIGSTAMADKFTVPAELRGKTVTIVVPYGPGGQSDLRNRIPAAKIKELTDLNVIIVNRPGGEGLVGTAEVANAKPDGLTLLGTDNGPVIMPPLLRDPNAVSRDRLTTVLVSDRTQQGIFVNADSKYQTLQDLIKDIRARPGKVTYGCGYMLCTLAANHLLAEIKGSAVETKYKSVPQAATDLMGNHIDFIIGSPVALAQVRAGKLRVLAFSGNERLSEFANVGLIKDTVPGLVFENFAGIFAPSGTPKHIVEFYNRLYREAFKDATWQDFLQKSNAQSFDGGPDAAEKFVSQGSSFWKPIVEKYGDKR